MTEKEYDLIKSTVDSIVKMKKDFFWNLGEYFEHTMFDGVDLDDDDAVEKWINNRKNRCKWLSIWATKGLDESMELDYNEETNKWTLTF